MSCSNSDISPNYILVLSDYHSDQPPFLFLILTSSSLIICCTPYHPSFSVFISLIFFIHQLFRVSIHALNTFSYLFSAFPSASFTTLTSCMYFPAWSLCVAHRIWPRALFLVSFAISPSVLLCVFFNSQTIPVLFHRCLPPYTFQEVPTPLGLLTLSRNTLSNTT